MTMPEIYFSTFVFIYYFYLFMTHCICFIRFYLICPFFGTISNCVSAINIRNECLSLHVIVNLSVFLNACVSVYLSYFIDLLILFLQIFFLALSFFRIFCISIIFYISSLLSA